METNRLLKRNPEPPKTISRPQPEPVKANPADRDWETG